MTKQEDDHYKISCVLKWLNEVFVLVIVLVNIMAKQKFYVVWDGAEDGVFTSWEACQQAVSGYSNAKYKSFKSEEEAEAAFEMGYDA